MDQDCISQASYFGGRREAGTGSSGGGQNGPFEGEVAASIVLHGTDGSVLRHQLRTGLSVADPSAARVLLDHAVSLAGSGFVTIERGRLLSGEIDPVGVRNQDGEATRLTMYLSRGDHVYQVPAFEVICELLHRRGIAGATVLEGAAGSVHGNGAQRGIAARHGSVPVMVVAVSAGDVLGLLLPELAGLLRRPVFTLEPVQVCKRDGQLISAPLAVPAADAGGGPQWQKLAVYACGSARHGGQPVHRAIIRGLDDAGIGSAVTVHGVWGFRGDQVPHGSSGHVPAVTVVAGVPERIEAAFAVIDPITAGRSLVTCNLATGGGPGPGGTWRRRYLRRTSRP